MKKSLNIIAFAIISFIILIFFLGFGLSGGNIDREVIWGFIVLVILFLIATYDSFHKPKLSSEPTKTTLDFKFAKFMYYGVLIFGALVALEAVIFYLVTK